jgi:hypothetical protein
MSADLLNRKASHFALWRPRHTSPSPRLVIGKLKPGNPPVFVDSRRLALQTSPKGSDLWEIPVTACALSDGEIHQCPGAPPPGRQLCRSAMGVRHQQLFRCRL